MFCKDSFLCKNFIFFAGSDMQLNKKCRTLVSEIDVLLNDGIELSGDVLHYIDSTFEYPTVKQLEQILSDKDNLEADVLCELIFYPDEFIQMRFENILEENSFSKDDEINIVRYLSGKGFATKLYFPDDRGILDARAGESVIKAFISRLNIKKQINEKVIEAVNKNLNCRLKRIVKVHLRNTAFLFTDNRVDFLCCFFKSGIIRDNNFIQYFKLLLGFLGEIGKDEDIRSYLTAKKIKSIQEIEKAKRILLQLKRDNIETMMMRNIYMPAINVEDEKEKIILIDKIMSAVF